MKPELPLLTPAVAGLAAPERIDGISVQARAAVRGGTRSLDTLALREPAVIRAVAAPAHAPEWAAWLAEIGFLPGEAVMLLARGRPGGDPLVVRVGDSTFALRRAEAACVHISSSERPAG